jgi:FkbM family methyltransferase
MRPTPLSILVIGAYAGYTAVDLARRHPRANLLAVEPLPDNFRLLSLNTAPWRRIHAVNVALWHHKARLTTDTRLQADWVVALSDQAEIHEREVPAITPGEVLANVGWRGLDMVVCDASGCEREIFADPLSPWLRHLDVAMVRIYDVASPGAGHAVQAAFAPDLFERHTLGELTVFVRRTPLRALPPAPPELPLLRDGPGVIPFVLEDVARLPGAFFVYDASNCQLHPNAPGGKPARVAFPVRLSGQTRFSTTAHHAGRDAAPVQFTAAVFLEDGTLLGRNDTILGAREHRRVTLDLPAHWAPARVVLQTQMVANAPSHGRAWARWLNPKLS